jgi:hypothetical protein
MRYDTQGSFTSPSSYLVFDIHSIDNTTHGFIGGTFDGRYIYFSPWYASGSYQSVAFRYDTQAPLTSTSSWSSYDLTNVDTNAEGYFGCVFDGRYVTFVPLRHLTNQSNGLVIQFDTHVASFTTPTAWNVFDTKTAISSTTAGFAGAAFDGTYLYFVPQLASAARYDTTHSLTDTTAWKSYATGAVNSDVNSMEFGGFDGR